MTDRPFAEKGRPAAGREHGRGTLGGLRRFRGLFGVEERPPGAPAPMPAIRLAQFQVPQAGSREGSGPSRQKAEELAKELDYQYSWGSDTELIVERNNGLRNSGNGNAARPSRG